jgi:hypothetical protein
MRLSTLVLALAFSSHAATIEAVLDASNLRRAVQESADTYGYTWDGVFVPHQISIWFYGTGNALATLEAMDGSASASVALTETIGWSNGVPRTFVLGDLILSRDQSAAIWQYGTRALLRISDITGSIDGLAGIHGGHWIVPGVGTGYGLTVEYTSSTEIATVENPEPATVWLMLSALAVMIGRRASAARRG